MKKHRILPLLAAILLMASAFAGCQASAPFQVAPPAEAAASAAPAESAAAAEGSSTDASTGGSLPAIDTGNPAAAGQKIIYTAQISIETKQVEAAINSITAAAVAAGGYMSDQQYYAADREQASTITVRIPPAKLKEFSEKVKALGKVLDSRTSSQNVTDQYYDVESRLTNALAQEAQLLEIMKKAVKIDDILHVRQELNTVQQEIEQLKGQKRLMDDQIGLSTVTVLISQPKPPAVVEDDTTNDGVQFWGFKAIGQKIGRGFTDSFNWTLNAIGSILMAISYVIIPLLLIALVVFAIIFIVKLATRGKKNPPKA